jgi:tetratricopeptide (TPR) repeat protein
MLLGQAQDALSDLTRAIELDRSSACAYHNRASAFGQLGRHIDTIADANHPIRLNNHDVNAYMALGLAQAQPGNRLLAIDDPTKAIELVPDNGFSTSTGGRVAPCQSLDGGGERLSAGDSFRLVPSLGAFKSRHPYLKPR